MLHAVTPDPHVQIISFINEKLTCRPNFFFRADLLKNRPFLSTKVVNGILILPGILPLFKFFLGSSSKPKNLFFGLASIINVLLSIVFFLYNHDLQSYFFLL